MNLICALRAIIIYLFVFLLPIYSVLACDCAEENIDINSAYIINGAIFSGVVERIIPISPYDYVVRVRPLEFFKKDGSLISKDGYVYIGSSNEKNSCSFSFKTGGKYLLYANRKDKIFWTVNLCGKSSFFSTVMESELDTLRNLRAAEIKKKSIQKPLSNENNFGDGQNQLIPMY